MTRDEGRFTCEGGAPWELEYEYQEEQAKGESRYDTRTLGEFPELEAPCGCELCLMVRRVMRKAWRRRSDD
jgi:hypothetical protein